MCCCVERTVLKSEGLPGHVTSEQAESFPDMEKANCPTSAGSMRDQQGMGLVADS